MSFLRRVEEGQENEPRVLKAQLALAATSVRNTHITSPAWALLVSVLCSIGIFGHAPFAVTLFLPLAVGVAVGASALMVEEAGGIVTRFSGAAVTGKGDILAASKALHPWLQEGFQPRA